jgi:hypothetical protein
MSSVELTIVPTPSRRAVSSVAQVSDLNVGWSSRVPRNRKGQSRRALSLLRGTGGSNPSPSSAESATNRCHGVRGQECPDRRGSSRPICAPFIVANDVLSAPESSKGKHPQ